MSDAAVVLAQPFLAAVTETFDGLLGIEAIGTLVADAEPDDRAARESMTALIEFAGPRFGVVLVTFPIAVARATVERLLQDVGGVEEGDVSDGVGELANIIAGRAKAVLSALGLGTIDMSTPTVVTGFSLADLGLHDADWSRIDFATEVGTFTLRVAFARKEKTVRVLLADDSKVMRKIERSALVDLASGVEFLEAGNGAELMARFDEVKSEVSLVVLDVKMPEVDGYEALRLLRAHAHGKTIPVVVVSSLARAETEPRIKASNGDGPPVAFVGKPFDARVLLETARELLGIKDAYGEEAGA
jgi:CheY-like chemotaxis protein/CheY-specific phosphatase CheX